MLLNDLNADEKMKFKDVAEELRCLVCQNQSLADSQAGLADDLKQKIVEQIRQGKSKEDIKLYMESRYGEFILYQPEISGNNAVLWLGPFVVVVLGIILARRQIRKQTADNLKRAPTKSTPTGEEERLPTQHDAHWAERLYSQQRNRQDD